MMFGFLELFELMLLWQLRKLPVLKKTLVIHIVVK